MTFFKDDKCPICEQKVERTEYVENHILAEYHLVCKNTCCLEQFAYGDYRFIFFGKEEEALIWSYSTSAKELNEIDDRIKQQISYWRYNDRYLMELLTR